MQFSYMPQPAKIFAQDSSSIDQIISLKSGFNFVSFTVTPPASPSEFKSKDSNIEDIYLYSAAAGSFLSVGEGSLTTLSVGKGYIIKSKADTSITINGPPAAAIGDITLKKGFNLLGFSKSPAAAGASALTMSRLIGRNSLITGLYKWSAAAGTFVQVVRDSNGIPLQLDSIDAELKAGEAYFILCAGDISLNYDNGISSPRTLSGAVLSPSSDTAAAGGTYDLSKVKVYGLYSDGTTGEISAAVTYTADTGSISLNVLSLPASTGTLMVKASCLPAGASQAFETYLTLTMIPQTGSGGGPAAQVFTRGYKCSYKLASNVRIVDEVSMITKSFDGVNLVLGGPGVSTVAAGDILVGYHGSGYIRKVSYFRKSGSDITVFTTASQLNKVFEELDYQYSGKLSALASSNGAAPASSEYEAVSRFLSSSAVMAPAVPDKSIVSSDKLKKIIDSVEMSVELTKADIIFDPVINCDIQIGLGRLKKFLFMIGGELNAGVAFDASISAFVTNSKFSEITLYQSLPYIFTVGPVPFSFDWNIKCGIEALAGAVGTFSYSGDLNYSVRVGAEYDGTAWKKINDISKTVKSTDNFDLSGSIRLKPYLSAEFLLTAAGVAGPKVSFEAFLEMIASFTYDMKINLSVMAGAEASASFTLEAFTLEIASYSAELFSLSWELYKKIIDNYVAPPVFVTYPGGYEEGQKITIAAGGTESVVIKYTTDGSDPVYESSKTYSAPVLIPSGEGNFNLRAAAFKTNSEGKIVSSEIISGSYFVYEKGVPGFFKLEAYLVWNFADAIPRTRFNHDPDNPNYEYQNQFPKVIYFKNGTKIKFSVTNNNPDYYINGYSTAWILPGNPYAQRQNHYFSGEDLYTVKSRSVEITVGSADAAAGSVEMLQFGWNLQPKP